MTDRARVSLLITGIVQGVNFRYHTYEEARRLGVSGWVRNLADGRVEVLAEGDRRELETFVAWCRHGPRLADVEGVEAIWQPYAGDLQSFEVVREAGYGPRASGYREGRSTRSLQPVAVACLNAVARLC